LQLYEKARDEKSEMGYGMLKQSRVAASTSVLLLLIAIDGSNPKIHVDFSTKIPCHLHATEFDVTCRSLNYLPLHLILYPLPLSFFTFI